MRNPAAAARGCIFAQLVVVSLLLLAATETVADNKPSVIEARIDTFMSELMEVLDVVPGYSVAVTSPDAILLVRGYGFADPANGEPMDADTQVYVASLTKSMTGLAVASLANKGLLDLDVAIEEYLPTLNGTPAGASSLRRLLSHSHGLEGSALSWRTAYSGDYTPAILMDIVTNMRKEEGDATFNYSNTGYVIAGIVLEQRFGKSWKDIVEDEVLSPAGMDSTTAWVSALADDYAKPHSWLGVKNTFPLAKRDNTMHAAGGHFSTANDLARWLMLQLSDGRIDGRQVFAPGLVNSTRAANAELDMTFYTYRRKRYGLGWYEAEYDGRRMYQHFGSYSGYRAHASFVPELEIGVAVMINDASRPGFHLPDLVANYIYDLAAGVEQPEAKARTEIARIVESIRPMAGKTPPERPRRAPADEARYAGSYRNKDFGEIEFSMSDGELKAAFGNLSSRITYREDGTVRMELTPYRGTLGRFVEDEDGVVNGFQYRGAYYVREPEADPQRTSD